MTAANHALTGAAIAAVVKQPLLALPLAFISHFVCDALPHFGIDMKFRSKQMYTWLAVDGILAVACAAALLLAGVSNPLLLAVAGFFAMSPDLAWLYYGLKGKLEDKSALDLLSRFHSNIQWYQKVPGLGVEIIWAVMMFTVILRVQ
jgi:hypothetical protein